MRLDEWMRTAGVAQSELARALGVSQMAVNVWARRKGGSPSLPQALAIARLTRGVVTLEDLLSEEGEVKYHRARRGADALSGLVDARLTERAASLRRAEAGL